MTRDTFRCYYCKRRLDEYCFGGYVLDKKDNGTIGKACLDCQYKLFPTKSYKPPKKISWENP